MTPGAFGPDFPRSPYPPLELPRNPRVVRGLGTRGGRERARRPRKPYASTLPRRRARATWGRAGGGEGREASEPGGSGVYIPPGPPPTRLGPAAAGGQSAAGVPGQAL